MKLRSAHRAAGERTDTRFQFGFATEAKARLRARDQFVLSASPAELNSLTAGTARYWIVLSHYALVTRDPGGRAA